jgi:hypothetical protein
MSDSDNAGHGWLDEFTDNVRARVDKRLTELHLMVELEGKQAAESYMDDLIARMKQALIDLGWTPPPG